MLWVSTKRTGTVGGYIMMPLGQEAAVLREEVCMCVYVY